MYITMRIYVFVCNCVDTHIYEYRQRNKCMGVYERILKRIRRCADNPFIKWTFKLA